MSEPSPEHIYIAACPAGQLQSDGTCAVAMVWMPYPQPVLPPLTLAEGTLVAFSIVGVWAIGLKGRAVFRAARMGVF